MNIRRIALAVVLLLWTIPTFGQGCVMCYSSAKGASDDGQKAIRKGVIVLLLPPLSFMSLGVWMASRYARKRDLEKSRPATQRSGAPSAKVMIFAHPAGKGLSQDRMLR